MKYPKIISVQWNKDEPDNKWLNATKNASNLDDGEIAVYTLTNKIRKETKTLLHPIK